MLSGPLDHVGPKSSPRVAIIYGGKSPQRERSLTSGTQVAAALAETGCRVRAFDPAEVDLRDIDWRDFDVAYVALLGGAGEDGSVQRLLAALHVPIAGSSAEACALAASKRDCKKRLLAHGIPTAPYRVLSDAETFNDWVRQSAPLGFPVVVKPNSQVASLGVGLANDSEQLQNCLAESFLYGSRVLVETFLAGREFTAGVVGRRTLPLLQIVCPQPIYGSQQKMDPSEVEFLTEGEIGNRLTTEVKHLAVRACEAVGTAGLASVDFRCDRAGRPYVLEVNTAPMMGTDNLIPRAARLAELTVAELCLSLIDEALSAATGGRAR